MSQEANAIRQWDFGQLREYKMGNIFCEKLYPKWGGETIPRPFSKKSKLSLSVDH